MTLRTTADNVNELRCGDDLSLYVAPAYSDASLNVVDENEDEIFDDSIELSPNYSIDGYCEALEDGGEDYSEDIESYNKAEFVEPIMPCFKNAWDKLKEPGSDESKFILGIINEATDNNSEVEMELTIGSEECPIVVTFEIELEEDEDFDPSKLDFVNVDAACDGQDKIIASAFEDDVVLLNIVRYGDKFYQHCGDDDGFDNIAPIYMAVVDCSKENFDL